MGCRANFVVIEQGAAKAYYAQWGGMGCVYSFADGPDSAVAAMEDMEEVDGLMDWAFAEGGYLIDLDRRSAIVFGSPMIDDDQLEEMDDDMAEEVRSVNQTLDQGARAYLEHITPAWNGWQITWDQRGVDAFALHLAERGITTVKVEPASHPASTEPPETIHA